MKREETTPQVYVSTYAKYNNGNLKGEWVDLDGFDSYDEFIGYCKELHADEADPEFMYQDYEGFPHELYCECMGEKDFNKILQYIELCGERDPEEVEDYIECFGVDELENYEDTISYGQFDNDEDFGIYYVENFTEYNQEDGLLIRYFDYERFGRDLMFDCYQGSNGYVFQR